MKKKLKDFTNSEISKMVMFKSKEQAKKILEKKFPDSIVHHIHVFSDGSCDIKIDDRHIQINTKV